LLPTALTRLGIATAKGNASPVAECTHISGVQKKRFAARSFMLCIDRASLESALPTEENTERLKVAPTPTRLGNDIAQLALCQVRVGPQLRHALAALPRLVHALWVVSSVPADAAMPTVSPRPVDAVQAVDTVERHARQPRHPHHVRKRVALLLVAHLRDQVLGPRLRRQRRVAERQARARRGAAVVAVYRRWRDGRRRPASPAERRAGWALQAPRHRGQAPPGRRGDLSTAGQIPARQGMAVTPPHRRRAAVRPVCGRAGHRREKARLREHTRARQ
jgi:hypothetical protein